MSKLEELIEKLCPNGVEFKELQEICNVSIGEFVHKNKQREDAIYPVFNGGISNTGFYDEYNNEGNKVLVSARGANAGFVNKIETRYWAGNSCYSIAVKDNEYINWLYVYYFLKNNEKNLLGQQQTGSIPAISKKQIESFKIAVPPLEVQCEIVHILDDFTLLSAELSAELKARQKQYEYYRDKLLTLDKSVEKKELQEVCELVTGATPSTSKKEFWDNGDIPWMNSGEVNLKRVYETEKKITKLGYDNASTTLVPPHTVVIALAGQGKTRGKVAITEIELCTNQSLCSIICGDKINYKYLYYYLDSKYENLRAISNGDGTRGGLSLKLLKPYEISVPPMEEQEKIVNVLEKLDKLCNDISEGLPAEIEVRQKQYEYYRNKLLTFKELKVKE